MSPISPRKKGRQTVRSIVEKKMGNILIADGPAYSGLYVVTDGPLSKEVVAAAASPERALLDARAAGATDPVLVYVPREDERTLVY